jgi:hypothetical protein
MGSWVAVSALEEPVNVEYWNSASDVCASARGTSAQAAVKIKAKAATHVVRRLRVEEQRFFIGLVSLDFFGELRFDPASKLAFTY